MSNVRELPVGKYDAVRTLRHCLQLAEKGEIDNVVLVCQYGASRDEPSDKIMEIWASWSDMERADVLWLTRWLNSFINHRYFARYHDRSDL